MQNTNSIHGRATESTRADVRDRLTDKLVAMLEQDGLKAMQRWKYTAGTMGRPVNATTGKPYNGGNVIFLWIASMEAGYESSKWMTFNQARQLGGSVRKGEKGTLCAYWNRVETKDSREARKASEAAGGELEAKEYLMCKPFYLFNVEQIDGLPDEFYAKAEKRAPEVKPIEAAERLIAASGATVNYGGNRACFIPSLDIVKMPKPEQFVSPELFYATIQHELTHWTGHSSRLAREFGKRFGDEAYAFEELVAELGAAFLAAEIGFVDATVENHAHYLQSWLKVLKNDRSAIFTAARKASEAADYLLECMATGEVKKAA